MYEWRVQDVFLETTPWMKSRDPAEGDFMTRSDSKRVFTKIDKTNSYNDDNGFAYYILKVKNSSKPFYPTD